MQRLRYTKCFAAMSCRYIDLSSMSIYYTAHGEHTHLCTHQLQWCTLHISKHMSRVSCPDWLDKYSILLGCDWPSVHITCVLSDSNHAVCIHSSHCSS